MTIEDKIKTLTIDQSDMFKLLSNESLYQFRVPTGFGKGYVMMIDILNKLINTNKSKFLIASHRLSLNNQHLRDLINDYINMNLIGSVRFLTIGSSKLSVYKVLENDIELAEKFDNELFEHNFNLDEKNKTSINDIFKISLNSKEIRKILNENDEKGFKTIIISTYHSMDKLKDIKLNDSYFDEAHILASNKEDADFRKSFELIESDSKFFFTATPKDMQEELLKEDGHSDIFLMNNINIFGESFEVSFKKCVQMGYIVEPIIHIAHPKNMQEDTNYNSIPNKAKFILDSFYAHEEWLKKTSFKPNLIDAKILVRCEGVKEMWALHEELIKITTDDIIICAGASYNDDGEKHYYGDESYKSRDEFVKRIQDAPSEQKMIILNFDIFSEGINVPGITGTMYAQGKIPSISKVIQTLGRSTRLHLEDRTRLRNKEIEVGGDNWIKPNCAAIIPYWDDSSDMTRRILSGTIKKLRDKLDFSPTLILSVGDDMAMSDETIDLDNLNKLDDKNKKWKLIDEINHDIEELNNMERLSKEDQRLVGMNEIEWYEYLLNKK